MTLNGNYTQNNMALTQEYKYGLNNPERLEANLMYMET